MKKYTVYKHISPSNKVYIGITTEININKRWKNGKGYIHNQYFTRAINKYGWNNFKHIIIAKGLTEDEAKWLEIELIKIYDSTNKNKGYNITKGGEGTSGWSPSEETKEKMRRAKEGYVFTDEHRRKLSENHNLSGENNGMYGKRGKECPNTKHIVLCLTTGKSFYGCREAGDYYNIKSYKNIYSCCNGRLKSVGKLNGKKLKWIFLKGNILLNFSHNKIYRIIN